MISTFRDRSLASLYLLLPVCSAHKAAFLALVQHELGTSIAFTIQGSLSTIGMLVNAGFTLLDLGFITLFWLWCFHHVHLNSTMAHCDFGTTENKTTSHEKQAHLQMMARHPHHGSDFDQAICERGHTNDRGHFRSHIRFIRLLLIDCSCLSLSTKPVVWIGASKHHSVNIDESLITSVNHVVPGAFSFDANCAYPQPFKSKRLRINPDIRPSQRNKRYSWQPIWKVASEQACQE